MKFLTKDLEEWVIYLESKGLQNIELNQQAPKITYLPNALPQILSRQKLCRRKPAVLQQQTIDIRYERDSHLLGYISLQLIIKRSYSGDITCSIKPIGSRQLELFASPEVAIDVAVAQYNQFFRQFQKAA